MRRVDYCPLEMKEPWAASTALVVDGQREVTFLATEI
jgi:hypothetical protein